MKNVLVLIALVTVGAFAATKVNRSVTFKQLVEVAKEAAEGTENGPGCSLQIKESARGLQLSMVTDDETVKVFVPRSFSIRLTGADDSDGSYEHTYTIAGKGKLILVHMDDAYFHTTLKNTETGESADCDIDF